MPRPYRIGVISGSLAQAGAQRYVYELCRGLDRKCFAPDILTIFPWGVSRQYYADPLRRLGCRIRPLFPLMHFRSFPRTLRAPAVGVQNAYRRLVMPRLLSSYDLLAIVHMDYLCDVHFMLPPQIPVVVHLTTHLCQYDYDYYAAWPRSRRAYVVCMDRAQAREAAAALGNLIIEKTVTALPMDTAPFKPITSWPEPRRLTVGCFMRIAPDRHPMPVLKAFAELAKRSDARLVFYGAGDASQLRRETARLGISDRVTFPGHVRDMRQAVIDDGVRVAWLTAHDDFIGYAGLELGLLGVPTYFYNVGTGLSPQTILSMTGGAINSFANETALAEATLQAWQSPERLGSDVRSLQSFVREHYDSAHVVRRIEAFYRRIIEKDRRNSVAHLQPASGRRVSV